jgi:amidase
MPSPIHWMTTDELGAAYRQGELTSVEATRALLDRIDDLDGRLHAYAQRFSDEALATAARADERLRAGDDSGPLHGVPVAVKDLCQVRGHAAAAGTAVLRDRIADADAAVVERLRRAGAVILGTLAMTEGAYTSHHPSVTPPVNPWNAERWTGISSSGSGVAVAAGLCVGALGTDTGGSIRYPSAANALVGIKPTYGRVPRHGVFPLSATLDHVGPMCRSVRDAAVMLHTIAGPDPRDPTSALLATPDYATTLEDGVEGLRIGVDEAFVRGSSQDEIADTVLACAEVFADAGAQVVSVKVPDVAALLGAWLMICAADAAVAHEGLYPQRRDEYGQDLAGLLDFALGLSARDLARAFDLRREFAGRLGRVFSDIDLLMCPSLGVVVPPRCPDWNDLDFVAAVAPYTGPFDLSGNPTISLPCGFSSDGMPISLQLIGRHFEEEGLCRAAFTYEHATAWHARHPDV